MDYIKKIKSIDTGKFQRKLRTTMEEHYPGHHSIDFSQLVNVCTRRALKLWQENIVPDLDIKQQREFERQLPKIQMRAGLSIPRIFLFGYAFGLACHSIADGDKENVTDAASTTGLYMFILGLFDHLLDDYPEYFADMGKAFTKESIEQYISSKDYEGLSKYVANPLAKGMAELYRAYFIKCHRLVRNNQSNSKAAWLEELKRMHKVEAESVDRRISKVKPDKSIADHAIQPSLSAFRVLAISSCLEKESFNNEQVEEFARSYATLTWLVDDVSDLEKDLDEGIWSGLAVRLATEVANQDDADKLIKSISEQASNSVASMHKLLNDYKWEEDDQFSIADILWYVIWSWCGGQPESNILPKSA